MRDQVTHAPKPIVSMEDVKTYLASEKRDVLAQLLLERAYWDEALRNELFLRVARTRKNGRTDALKEAIDRAVKVRGYIDWRGAGEYARGVQSLLETLQGAFAEGQAGMIELCEYALAAAEEACSGHVDDSDGHFTGIFKDLEALHHAAALKEKPEPMALARRLFEREVGGGFDVFYCAVEGYADVLGKDGVAEYRRLAEREWAEVKPLRANEHDASQFGRRSRLANILETLARAAGDVEAEVAVLEKNLSEPHGYLKVARRYREAGQRDRAMEWAQKGLAAFADRPDSRLRDFLADELHEQGAHALAMEHVWANFLHQPGVNAFGKLKAHADRSGEWPAWREKALAHIRDQMMSGKVPSWSMLADASALVDIYLWEKDSESAWNAAQARGCKDGLWLQLAEAREGEHPADAVAIYQKQTEKTLQHADQRHYQDAVRLIGKVAALLKRTGRTAELEQYLARIQEAQARRPAFIRLLGRGSGLGRGRP